jgi:hypothetical protein
MLKNLTNKQIFVLMSFTVFFFLLIFDHMSLLVFRQAKQKKKLRGIEILLIHIPNKQNTIFTNINFPRIPISKNKNVQ